MTILKITILLTALLSGLVAGFLFAFAVVVMPGIARLSDGAFIRAFQVMDGVIQASQPLFVLMWLGSIIGIVASLGLGIRELSGPALLLLGLAAVLFLGAVQAPTFLVNIPLNNGLQAVDVAAMDAAALSVARAEFENVWNRWNVFRTVASVLTTVLLMVTLAFRL